MDLNIRFVKRPDGERIAYMLVGSGPPFVRAPGQNGHLEIVAEHPMLREFVERMAAERTVILYDRHGCGLSDRNRTEFTWRDDVIDLETIFDSLGLESAPLMGVSACGPATIAYAAAHPERVSQLILYGTMAIDDSDRDRYPGLRAYTAILDLLDTNPALASRLFTELLFPSGISPEVLAISRRLNQASSPEIQRQLLTAPRRSVKEEAPKIRTPTLVLHRRGDQAVPFEAGRDMAQLIPGARFLPLDGNIHIEMGDLAAPILAFLHEFESAGEAPAPPRDALAGSTFRTILFTDIENHTQMMQRLGDTQGRNVLREQERLTRAALQAHGGTEVKSMGDGFMASFGSAQRALECAIDLQKAFAARPPDQEPLRVRVGINAGEPVEEDADLFGTAVIIAARTAAKASGGEILVTDVVRQLVAGKGFAFDDRGEGALRGIEEPVRLYEVRWAG